MKKKTILELDRISQEEFKKKNKIPLIVILDNVRSLNNVGSVFRTSRCFFSESCLFMQALLLLLLILRYIKRL